MRLNESFALLDNNYAFELLLDTTYASDTRPIIITHCMYKFRMRRDPLAVAYYVSELFLYALTCDYV